MSYKHYIKYYGSINIRKLDYKVRNIIRYKQEYLLVTENLINITYLRLKRFQHISRKSRNIYPVKKVSTTDVSVHNQR